MAVTATRGNGHREVHFSFPIARKEYTPEGDLIVYGPCTDGTLDSDHQKVDPKWSAGALKSWIGTGGNIRVQHSPFLYPAGKGLALEAFKDGTDQHWLKALVARSTPAFDLVEKGILRDFSIGVLDPVTTFNDFGAPGGTICGGEVGEVSLVDRGSNKNTSFTIVKSAGKGGTDEFVWKLKFGGGSPTPLTMQARQVARLHAYKTWTVPVQKRKNKDGTVTDSSGKDRSGVADSDFAGPDKTFPIETQDDVSDAASLAHHAKNPAKVRRRISAIASRKWPGMKKPPSLAGSSTKVTKADDSDDGPKCPLCKGSGKIREGHVTCPKCKGDGKASASDSSDFANRAARTDLSKGDASDDYPGDSDNDDEEPADYDAGSDDDSDSDKDSDSKDSDSKDSDDDDDDDSKSDKAVDARKLRKKLIKSQRAALKDALSSNGGSTPADAGWHPDPDVSDSGPAKAKDKKMRPAAAHREPDGAQAEGTEADAGMTISHESGDQTGVKGSDWATKSAGPSYGMSRLHDAICPHFRWRDVRQAYSLKSVGAALPGRELETQAIEALLKGRFDEAAYLTGMLELAGQMRHIGPDMLTDARKAYDGLFPTVHPTMQSDVRPSQFNRGYLSSGHPSLAASGASSGNKLPNATVHQISAGDFGRGFLSAGHSSMSPSGGTQATAGTAAFGQALNSLDRMHQAVTQLWPDMCPVTMDRQDYAAVDSTGISGSGTLSPAPAVSIGEAANKVASVKTEKRLRAKLAKAARKVAELKEENDRLGSMPDPELAPYRGLPELGGPVDRRSLVGKAVGGADSEIMSDDDQFAEYVAMFATSGNPGMRANAAKVLAGLLPK